MCPSLRLAFTARSSADGLVLLWSSTRGISRLHVPEASRVSASVMFVVSFRNLAPPPPGVMGSGAWMGAAKNEGASEDLDTTPEHAKNR